MPVQTLPTIAEGTAIAKPVRTREVLAAIRRSGGAAVSVSEEEIVEAMNDLAKSGLYVEPTCASAAAALSGLLRRGVIRPEQTTVVVLTGTGLKGYPARRRADGRPSHKRLSQKSRLRNNILQETGSFGRSLWPGTSGLLP
jgi:threonine synthase